MNVPLRLLLIEDSEDDALLILRELKRAGYKPTYERVETAVALQAAPRRDLERRMRRRRDHGRERRDHGMESARARDVRVVGSGGSESPPGRYDRSDSAPGGAPRGDAAVSGDRRRSGSQPSNRNHRSASRRPRIPGRTRHQPGATGRHMDVQ